MREMDLIDGLYHFFVIEARVEAIVRIRYLRQNLSTLGGFLNG